VAPDSLLDEKGIAHPSTAKFFSNAVEVTFKPLDRDTLLKPQTAEIPIKAAPIVDMASNEPDLESIIYGAPQEKATSANKQDTSSKKSPVPLTAKVDLVAQQQAKVVTDFDPIVETKAPVLPVNIPISSTEEVYPPVVGQNNKPEASPEPVYPKLDLSNPMGIITGETPPMQTPLFTPHLEPPLNDLSFPQTTPLILPSTLPPPASIPTPWNKPVPPLPDLKKK